MTKEEFKKLAEEHLFILEGYNLDKEGNKEMKIYGFDALFEQLTIPAVVGRSEQLPCAKCENGLIWSKDRLKARSCDCGK